MPSRGRSREETNPSEPNGVKLFYIILLCGRCEKRTQECYPAFFQYVTSLKGSFFPETMVHAASPVNGNRLGRVKLADGRKRSQANPTLLSITESSGYRDLVRSEANLASRFAFNSFAVRFALFSRKGRFSGQWAVKAAAKVVLESLGAGLGPAGSPGS